MMNVEWKWGRLAIEDWGLWIFDWERMRGHPRSSIYNLLSLPFRFPSSDANELLAGGAKHHDAIDRQQTTDNGQRTTDNGQLFGFGARDLFQINNQKS
jgi:hypothetical protein